MMERFFRSVIRHPKTVLFVFIAATIASAICIPFVKVNYDFAAYLPQGTASTISIEKMKDVFDEPLPNGRMYVEGLSIVDAKALYEDLKGVDGILSISWLGDFVDVGAPLSIYDEDLVSAWKSDNGFLYQIALDETLDFQAMEQGRELAAQYTDGKVAYAGTQVNTGFAKNSSGWEVKLIMLMGLVVIALILLLTSTSWFEPILFLIAICIAIVINLGTNIFKGEISFVTQICAAILQLAVSMDYAIVMLNTYRETHRLNPNREEAMTKAMSKSLDVIFSSFATTFFGFLSLSVMSLLIGWDMGIVLAKGVMLSFISVMLLLPVLIIIFEKPIARLTHKPILPSFAKFGRACAKISPVMAVIVVLLTAPAFIASQNIPFVYGASGFVEEGSTLYDETMLVNEEFGANEQWVLIVPSNQWANEKAMIAELEDLPIVDQVISYTTSGGDGVPTAMVDQSTLEQLMKDGYSRLVVSTKVVTENQVAFDAVRDVRAIADKYYPEESYLVGASVSSFDLSTTVSSDMLKVTLAAIISIGLVLLFVFRNGFLPFILVLTIETAIWFNLSIPYLAGTELQYIGYLVISSIMLGATVDYTIIMAKSYEEQRESLPKKEAIRAAIGNSAVTILTSATILTVCGVLIGLISSNAVIASLGMLIGRGAFISAINTFLLLPTLLVLFDKPIQKLSFKRKGKKAIQTGEAL